MGVHKKGGLVGGFDQLRAPDAPTISVSAGFSEVTVTITNPSDVGGGSITGYAASALTGPIEDTTFAVTVVSSGGNKYAIDGSTQATLTLYKGHTYIFDQSDSSNSGHPLRLSTTSNGTHGGGSEYTTGVTTSGTPGSAGAFTKIAIATDAPDTLYYYCTNHSGMGGTANLKTSLQGGASGSSSPITISSLTNGESYNVRASAINAFGQSPYSDASTASPSSERGIYFGGTVNQNVIQYFGISSLGNTADFGDMSINSYATAAGSSSTRAYYAGGTGGSEETIEYITVASLGDATDFGNLINDHQDAAGFSNSTRGIIGGGRTPANSNHNIIEYITIASTGNATSFGLYYSSRAGAAGLASSTRGVFAGGEGSSSTPKNTIDYITIASTGDATNFGNLTVARRSRPSALSSSTRGVVAGGYDGSSYSNVMDYITIASTGNATDFGNLTAAKGFTSGTSNSTRGVFLGGYTGSANVDNIDYITIASTGNAQDFGDLLAANQRGSATSNVHGGIS